MPAIPIHRSPVEQRRLLTIQEAADWAGVSRATIYRRISDGSLTAHRFGPATVRIDRDELLSGSAA